MPELQLMTYTPKQIAHALQVNESTIRRIIEQGEMTGYRIGSQLRVTEEDLKRYLEKARTTAIQIIQ